MKTGDTMTKCSTRNLFNHNNHEVHEINFLHCFLLLPGIVHLEAVKTVEQTDFEINNVCKQILEPLKVPNWNKLYN